MNSSIMVAAVAAFIAGVGGAQAQSYPSRPITMIAPFPAGGPSDALARILSEPMRAALGQPVVIENVAGAGGNIGMGRLARAAPDGYTVGIGQWSTMSSTPSPIRCPTMCCTISSRSRSLQSRRS
jgi:tripartite-type tricarboxylate transporter receptor subunit TctC